jgi:hypothetical protein
MKVAVFHSPFFESYKIVAYSFLSGTFWYFMHASLVIVTFREASSLQENVHAKQGSRGVCFPNSEAFQSLTVSLLVLSSQDLH